MKLDYFFNFILIQLFNLQDSFLIVVTYFWVPTKKKENTKKKRNIFRRNKK
jgi:hypothetical protein